MTPPTARAVSWPAEPPLAERLRLYRDLLATPPGPADGDRALDTVTEAGRNLRRDLLGPATDLLKDSRRVILAPDCGMKYLSRESAFGKLRAMTEAARELREEFSKR